MRIDPDPPLIRGAVPAPAAQGRRPGESGLSPMVPGAPRPQDRDMTQTPEQDRVATDHLRDYSGLRRSRTDRKIAGVAGGLGRHLNIDPTVLRVVFVVLSLFGG